MSILSAHIVLWSPEQHADLKVPASQPDQTRNTDSELLPAGCRVLTQVLGLSAVSLEPSSVFFNVGVPEPGISLVVIRPRPEPCLPVFSL